MFALLTLALSACGAKHVHNYTVISVSSPTCSSYGTEVVICTECGDRYYQKVSPSGHDYSEKTFSPSCESEGYTLYTCKTCGDSYKTDFISAYGHAFVTSTTEATCQSDGSIREICERCGLIENESVIAASEHVFAKTIVAATCEEEGYTVYECKNCGYAYNSDYTPKTPHSYILTVRRDVSDDTNGYEVYACAYCGKSYEKTLSATKHDYSEQIISAATCTTDGIKAFCCDDCGRSYTETIPALGHDYRSSVLVNPSCMAEGIVEYKCSRCSSSYIEQLSKSSHNFGEWQKATDPTSESEGLLRRYCVTPGCTHYEYFTLPVLSDKDYDYGVLLEPDSENDGAAYYIYEKDGLYFSFEEIIKKLDSDLVYKINESDCTCVVTGIKTVENEVVVPAYYGKYKVAEIRPFAFYGVQIEKITVHAAKICDDAFKNCKVKEVVVGDEVTEIGKNAFSDCDFLLKVRFVQGGDWFAVSDNGEILFDIDDEYECAVCLKGKYSYYTIKRY